MEEPKFLTPEKVLYLHTESLKRFGGSSGIRDRGQIESALGAAQNAFYYGRADNFEIAATYAFHVAECRAFIDGNKRTGIAAALAFIAENEDITLVDDGRLYSAMIDIAEKKLNKPGLAKILREMCAEQK